MAGYRGSSAQGAPSLFLILPCPPLRGGREGEGEVDKGGKVRLFSRRSFVGYEESPVIICPKCTKENQDHYKFCLGCGAELPRDASPKKFAPTSNTPPHGVPAVNVPPPADSVRSDREIRVAGLHRRFPPSPPRMSVRRDRASGRLWTVDNLRNHCRPGQAPVRWASRREEVQ